MSRATVTDVLEILGFLLLDAALFVGLWPFGAVWSLACTGAALFPISFALTALGPRPAKPGPDVA